MAAIELASTSLFTDANLEAYYKLENTTDSGPNGYTLTNNGTVTFVTGKFNNAANCVKTSSQYLSYASSLGYTGGAYSISGWYKPTSAPSGGTVHTLFAVSESTTDTVLWLGYYDNGGTPSIYGARTKYGVADQGPITAQTLTTGTWYHLAITYDGSNVRTYFNGSLLGGPTAASGSGNNGANSRSEIGNGAADNLTYFADGVIDDAAFFSRALTASEVAMLYSGLKFSTDTAGTLLAGIQAYYKLEDVNDSWVNGNNLTNNGSAIFAAGKVGNAVDLEQSSTQYLSITDVAQTNLDLNSNFTFAAWINMESNGRWNFILSKTNFNTGADISYSFSINTTNKMRLTIYGTSETEAVSTTALTNISTWYHVAVTYTKATGNVKFYLNGAYLTGEDGTVGTQIRNSAQDFMIGMIKDSGSASSTYGFDGLIDELGIWNKALSTTEITDLYNSGTGQTLVTAEVSGGPATTQKHTLLMMGVG